MKTVLYLRAGGSVAAAACLRQEKQQQMCGMMGKTQEKKAELKMNERELLE